MEVKIIGCVSYNDKLNLINEVTINPKETFERNYYDEIDSHVFKKFFADLTEEFVKEFNTATKRNYTASDVTLALAMPDDETFCGKDDMYDVLCDLINMPE